MESNIKELTRAEDEIMQILWQIQKGFVKDIIDRMPEPKPAYNTVSTIVRILVKKGFVAYNTYGKSHEYYPSIPKSEYSKAYLNNFMGRYFSGSFKNMVSFFAKAENLSTTDVEELMKHVKKELPND